MVCQKCLDVTEKHFGFVPRDFGFAAENIVSEILWSMTAWPICGPEQLDRQLTDITQALELGFTIGEIMAMQDRKTDEVMRLVAYRETLRGG